MVYKLFQDKGLTSKAKTPHQSPDKFNSILESSKSNLFSNKLLRLLYLSIFQFHERPYHDFLKIYFFLLISGIVLNTKKFLVDIERYSLSNTEVFMVKLKLYQIIDFSKTNTVNGKDEEIYQKVGFNNCPRKQLSKKTILQGIVAQRNFCPKRFFFLIDRCPRRLLSKTDFIEVVPSSK